MATEPVSSLASNWMLLAVILLFWGGCVSGMYTVGLSHLGTRLTGSDLVAANAAFVFCYAIGMVLGPPTVGTAMDIASPSGFAWAIAFFFSCRFILYVDSSFQMAGVRTRSGVASARLGSGSTKDTI